MSQVFNVSKVYDPRTNLTNAIIKGEGSINLTIEEGSSSVQYYQENSSSINNNSIQWTNITWSPALGLGRFVYASIPVRFIFSAAGVHASLINPNTDAPRSHFMRCVTTSSVSFGGANITENPNQYISALSWYNRKNFIPATSFSFAHILDNNNTYNPALNNNVLGQYGNNGIYGSEGRGAYEDILYHVRAATNDGTNTTQIVDVLYQEPLYVSPFMLSGDEKFGPPIVGINNGLSISLTCNPLPQLLWSHNSTASGITFSNIQVNIGDVDNFYGYNAIFHYQLFTIPRMISADPMHTSTVTQLNTTKVVVQRFSGIASGATDAPFQFNTFTPSSVPKFIYVFLNAPDNEMTVDDPFNFLTITSLSVTFGDGQNLLANIKTGKGVPFNSDLYQILCIKNGIQMTATQFAKYVGSVVCINPTEDLNLSKWTSGEANLTNLQILCTASNNLGKTLTTVQGTIVVIQEGALIYNGNTGNYEQITNIVNSNFLASQNVVTNSKYYYDKSDENYLGGLSLSSILRHIPVIGPYVEDAKDLGKLAAKYTHKALPYIEKATRQFDEGSGVIGGGVIGGKRMSKAGLRSKMLQYQ